MKPATIRKIFLLGTVSLALLFISCENFLKAKDTANQIKDAIEIANSNPTTIYIEAEKDSGTVTPAQVRVKKHESFEMKFTPSDSWKFIGWEVLDRTSLEPVTDVVKFDDATKLEVKASLAKSADNLLIRPKCLLLPAVSSSTPGASQVSYANTPIKITFNMPMEDETVSSADSLFKYGPQNIYISSGSAYMAEYFEVPRFNSDKTVLTLTPKASELQNFIIKENKPFIDIQISFGEKIIVKNGENELPMANTAREITARYRKDTESTPPEKYAFYAAASSDSTHFTQAALSTFGDTQILQNRTDGKIYIYGRYYDADSGVNSIAITEKHTNARDGSPAPLLQDTAYYTAANSNLTDDGNGTSTFGIEYDLKSDDGAILITVTVYDGCDNPAPDQTFTVIKDSGIDLSGVELWNFKNPIDSVNYFTYEGTGDGTKIQYDDWSSIVRSVKLNPIHRQIYKDSYVSETELEEVSLTYNSTTYEMTFNTVSNLWKLTIPEETDISGLRMTLTVEDNIGHKATKEFSFPDIPEILDIAQNPTRSYEYTAYISSNFNFSRIATAFDKRFSRTENGPTATSEDLNGGYPEFRSCSMSNPDSMAVTLRGAVPDGYIANSIHFYAIYSNYRIFLVKDQLAGLMTEEITITEGKSIDDTLPAVKISEATESVSADGNYLNIHIQMDTSTNPWETYKTIFVQFGSKVSTLSPSYTFFVNKNSNSFDIAIPYKSKVYNSTPFIKLCGLTDTNTSPDYTYNESEVAGWYQLEKPYTNPQKFEKIKPTIISDIDKHTADGIASISAIYSTSGFNIPERYDYMMPAIADDQESGLKTIIINANNCIWTYSVNDFYSLGSNHINFIDGGEPYDGGAGFKLPLIWDADKEYNALTITYYDAYNNCSVWNGNFIAAKIPSFSRQSNGTFKSEETTEALYQSVLGISQLNTSTYKWSKYSELTTTPTESTGPNNGKIYTYSSVSLPSNTFVKIIATAALEDDPMTKNFGNSSPTYYYTGATKNSGDYDYIIKNGSSKTSVLIASDAPTFVHTLVTKYPMSECQNWSVERWEHNHKHIGDKQISFTAENTTAKKYTIPVSQMDDGDCYVVIAHFADGTSAISEVMQN